MAEAGPAPRGAADLARLSQTSLEQCYDPPGRCVFHSWHKGDGSRCVPLSGAVGAMGAVGLLGRQHKRRVAFSGWPCGPRKAFLRKEGIEHV